VPGSGHSVDIGFWPAVLVLILDTQIGLRKHNTIILFYGWRAKRYNGLCINSRKGCILFSIIGCQYFCLSSPTISIPLH
jgi:hypothetical protein